MTAIDRESVDIRDSLGLQEDERTIAGRVDRLDVSHIFVLLIDVKIFEIKNNPTKNYPRSKTP